MKALLDTHTLIWSIQSSKKLGQNAAKFILAEDNQIYVSAASAWEIATKVRIGKLPEAVRLEREFVHAMVDISGFILLPIEVETALLAGRLPSDHRDPFDRILAAQALTMDIPILSADPQLDVFGVHRLW